MSLSHFLYDVNTLVLKLQNMSFKERLQFITMFNLLLCLSVPCKDMPMIQGEELKLSFRPWIQTYCPVTTVGQPLLFYSLCSITDVTSVLIYSLLSRKFKWHSKKTPKILNCWWLYVQATDWIYYCQFCTVKLHFLHDEFIYLFSKCYFTVLKYRTVLWKRSFCLTCFSVNLSLFPGVSCSSSLYMSQLYTDNREADCLSSTSILLGASLAGMCCILGIW